MKETESVLVTGAGGFVGRHLVGALAPGLIPLHALVRKPPSRPVPGVRYHVADIADREALRRVVRAARPRVVFHLAGITRRDDPRLVEVNALGTLALMQALAGSSVRRVVLAGTCEVYGENPAPFREAQAPRPVSAYARAKHAAERIALSLGRDLGIPVIVLRFSLLYGPGQEPGMFIPDLARAARSGRPFPMTEGRQKRDFLHVADAVRALVRAGLRAPPGSRIVNVASGRSVTLRSLAHRMERIARRRFIRFGAVPYRTREIRDYRVDVTRARRILGWRSEVPLDAGLASLAGR